MNYCITNVVIINDSQKKKRRTIHSREIFAKKILPIHGPAVGGKHITSHLSFPSLPRYINKHRYSPSTRFKAKQWQTWERTKAALLVDT